MNKHKHYARWSDRVTDPADKRAQVNIRLHPARRDELDELAWMHPVTRSRMIEALIQTAWQETQGQTIDLPNGGTGTGPVVDGEKNGHWVDTFLAGRMVSEGPYVDGKRNGIWVTKKPGDKAYKEEYRYGHLIEE